MAYNYTTLVGAKTVEGSIKNWVNRSDIPATDILTEAEAWIYERLRVREMQKKAVLTFLEGTSEVDLPDDYLDPIQYMPYNWGAPLPYVHEERLMADRDSSGNLYEGLPSRWTVIGETAEVNVACSEDFGGILLYYGTPTALSGSNTTNFLTTRYPKLLRMACLACAFEHMKDTARTQQYYQGAAIAIADAAVTNDLSRRGQVYPD